MRTLLYEAANVMLTRYKGQLKLKDWAFAIAKRSTMRKAQVALARRLEIIMHAMLRDGTEFEIGLAPRNRQDRRPIQLPRGATPREGADDGADCVARGQPLADCDFNLAALRPAYPIKRQPSAQRTQASQGVDHGSLLPCPLSVLRDVPGPQRQAMPSKRSAN